MLEAWAEAEWLTSRSGIPDTQRLKVFKVDGEINTDDFSPAGDAWSRPDIPLHGLAMLKNAREGIVPEKPGERGPIQLIEDLKKKGHPVAYVGDVVGTGSSRKSATNSVIWWTGEGWSIHVEDAAGLDAAAFRYGEYWGGGHGVRVVAYLKDLIRSIVIRIDKEIDAVLGVEAYVSFVRVDPSFHHDPVACP